MVDNWFELPFEIPEEGSFIKCAYSGFSPDEVCVNVGFFYSDVIAYKFSCPFNIVTNWPKENCPRIFWQYVDLKIPENIVGILKQYRKENPVEFTFDPELSEEYK